MELKNSTDEYLIQAIKSYDEAAFNELVTRYKTKAYNIAYYLVNEHNTAEDISQEAFIKVYKNIHTFRQKASFKTWFYRILINLCKNYLRKRQFISIFGGNNTSVDIPEKENSTKSAEVRYLVNKAIRSLSIKQKQVFLLKHIDGMKISEIAHCLNCSEGTVKSHLFRAVQVLQEKLKDVL